MKYLLLSNTLVDSLFTYADLLIEKIIDADNERLYVSILVDLILIERLIDSSRPTLREVNAIKTDDISPINKSMDILRNEIASLSEKLSDQTLLQKALEEEGRSLQGLFVYPKKEKAD